MSADEIPLDALRYSLKLLCISILCLCAAVLIDANDLKKLERSADARLRWQEERIGRLEQEEWTKIAEAATADEPAARAAAAAKHTHARKASSPRKAAD